MEKRPQRKSNDDRQTDRQTHKEGKEEEAVRRAVQRDKKLYVFLGRKENNRI